MGTPLRDWANPNYSSVNGRSVSSLEEEGNKGNHSGGGDEQIPRMPKTSLPSNPGGSGDGGRNKNRGSSVP